MKCTNCSITIPELQEDASREETLCDTCMKREDFEQTALPNYGAIEALFEKQHAAALQEIYDKRGSLQTYEVTLPGFDVEDSDTDDKILWVKAFSVDHVIAFITPC